MAHGPCGDTFRESFSCFIDSKAEPKGSDCYEVFMALDQCMRQYPSLYGDDGNDDNDGDGNDMESVFEQVETEVEKTESHDETVESVPEGDGDKR